MDKPKYGFGVKVAVLSIIVVQYSMSNVTPILGAIGEHFAGQGYDNWLKQIETIPTLVMVITGLSIGFLLKHFSKKTLLLAGTGIMFVFGCLPSFIGDSFWGIFVSRALMGFGMGIIYPFAASYVIDLFDGKERDSLMGIRSTVGAIAGIIISLSSGYLCVAFGYKAGFWIPVILIPIMILMAKYIPNDEIPAPKEKTDDSGAEKKFTKLSWVFILGNVLIMVCAYTFMTNIGIVVVSPVEAGGLGKTPATASNIMSVFSIVMAFSGLIFRPFFMKVFKRYTTIAGAIFLGTGLFIGFMAPSVAMLYVGAVVFGFGFQVYNASFVLQLSTTTSPQYVAYVTTIYMAFNGIGQYLSSLLVPAIASGVLPGNLRGDWAVASVGLIIIAVVAIISLIASGKETLNTQDTAA